MDVTFAQPVPGPRIVPYGQQRTARDVLPNGRPAFRVTQRFGDINPDTSINPKGLPHGATDLGNFNCGDEVYAVAAGKANTIGPDQYGALGIIVDHGGWSSLYWHLNAFSIPRGTAVPVARGQQIGIVGKTGLGAVCHLHFEVKVGGAKVDAEPYLFGIPFTTPEDDVNIPKGGAYLVQGVVGPANRLRTDPFSTEGSKVIGKDIGELKAYAVRVYELGVPGEPYTLDGKPGDRYAWVGVFDRTWYVAQPLLTDLRLTSLAPQPDVTAKLEGIRTAAAGAQQAIEAIQGLAR